MCSPGFYLVCNNYSVPSPPAPRARLRQLFYNDGTRSHAPAPAAHKLQIGVFNADDLSTVFSLAGSAEEKCARDATITLGNLAVVTQNQVAITDAGGLPPLVTVLNSNPYVSCQKFAARALYRLAAHGGNKPRIVAEGSLPPLVRRLRSPDAEVSRCVGMGWKRGCRSRFLLLSRQNASNTFADKGINVASTGLAHTLRAGGLQGQKPITVVSRPWSSRPYNTRAECAVFC